MIWKLQPNRVRRAYFGGEHIDALHGDPPVRGRYPEEWIASCAAAFNPDCPKPNEGYSALPDGTLLRDLLADRPVLLGRPGPMRLLLKLLDAGERLVIQAHPTRPFAKQFFHSAFGKTECWYFLNDGAVYIGFRPGITQAAWRACFASQDIDAMLGLLYHVPVRRGEMVFVAGGVPHAIDGGSFLAELQEPTDLMVIPERVTPSGVHLADEKLHGGLGFDRMFDCFTYDGVTESELRAKYWVPPRPVDAVQTVLLDRDTTDQFRMVRLCVPGAYRYPLPGYAVAVAIDGSGTLNGAPVRTGDSFFIDAQTDALRLDGTFTLLVCTE